MPITLSLASVRTGTDFAFVACFGEQPAILKARIRIEIIRFMFVQNESMNY